MLKEKQVEVQLHLLLLVSIDKGISKKTGLVGRAPLQIKSSGVAGNRVRDYSGFGFIIKRSLRFIW